MLASSKEPIHPFDFRSIYSNYFARERCGILVPIYYDPEADAELFTQLTTSLEDLVYPVVVSKLLLKLILLDLT